MKPSGTVLLPFSTASYLPLKSTSLSSRFYWFEVSIHFVGSTPFGFTLRLPPMRVGESLILGLGALGDVSQGIFTVPQEQQSI